MNGRELEVVFSGVYTLPDIYRETLSKAMSWEAICYLLNGLSIDLEGLVSLDEMEADGVG
ncbi:hypothetical protein MTBPR1_100029 [Candidatus Terasakiella magnetica]|uniref:Uncharacterized protein n=1 Tax=Candidatus Terasakiella magnetica TaxID=1867952 RepID=A0A1C3RDS2_9PROT|nr:hypothetical protein [Candidatus Terasakiella magnetica]SCA55388.1 hypothetical protein MTBPR1_100029 [Candidatus Terasakiella magnetica]